jgi:PAS domain-containing protein
LHPDDRERARTDWQQAVDTRSFYETEYRIRRADGVYVWHQARGIPILEADGSVREWFGICADIQQRKDADAKRVEAEIALRRLNDILEHRVEAEARERARIWSVSQDMLVVTDLEGTFLSLNPAWTTTLGWSEDVSAFQAVSADNHPIHYDVEYARRHGHTAPVVHGLQVLAFTAPGATLFPQYIGDAFIAFTEARRGPQSITSAVNSCSACHLLRTCLAAWSMRTFSTRIPGQGSPGAQGISRKLFERGPRLRILLEDKLLSPAALNVRFWGESRSGSEGKTGS